MSLGGQPFSLNFTSPVVSSQLLLPTAASTSKSSASEVNINSSSTVTPTNLPTSLTSPTISAADIMSAETLRFLSAGHPGLPPHIGLPPGRFDPSNPVPGGLPSLEQYRAMAPGVPIPFFQAAAGFGPLSDLKSAEGLPGGPLGPPQTLPGYYYDPTIGGYPYGAGPLDLNGARRKNATRETTAALKAWLYEHRKNPYPTKGEKIMLAIITKMTLTQVSTWFANARRRLKKENKMTWSPRNRPGEDDDDIGAGDDLERSASSLSNRSDLLPPDGSTVIKDDVDFERKERNGEQPERNNNSSATSGEKGGEDRLSGEKRPAPSPAQPESPTKKPKIWSIADTVATTAASTTSTSSSPPAPVSGGSARPSGSLEETSSTSASKKPDSSGPYHFTFNPWQQHMSGLAGIRPPFVGAPGFPAGAFSPLMSPPVSAAGAFAAATHFRPAELFGAAGCTIGGRPGFMAPHPALLAAAAGPMAQFGFGSLMQPLNAGSSSFQDAGSTKASVTSAVSPVSSNSAADITRSPKVLSPASSKVAENGKQ